MGFFSNLAAKIRGPQVTTYKINGQQVSSYDYQRYEEVRQQSFQKESLKQAVLRGRHEARMPVRQVQGQQESSSGLRELGSILGRAAQTQARQPGSFNFGHDPYKQSKMQTTRRK